MINFILSILSVLTLYAVLNAKGSTTTPLHYKEVKHSGFLLYGRFLEIIERDKTPPDISYFFNEIYFKSGFIDFVPLDYRDPVKSDFKFITAETYSKFIINWLDNNRCRLIVLNGFICCWRDVKVIFLADNRCKSIVEFQVIYEN